MALRPGAVFTKFASPPTLLTTGTFASGQAAAPAGRFLTASQAPVGTFASGSA